MITPKLEKVRITGKLSQVQDFINKLQELSVVHPKEAKAPEGYKLGERNLKIDDVSKLILKLNFLIEKGYVDESQSKIATVQNIDLVEKQSIEIIDKYFKQLEVISDDYEHLIQRRSLIQAQLTLAQELPETIKEGDLVYRSKNKLENSVKIKNYNYLINSDKGSNLNLEFVSKNIDNTIKILNTELESVKKTISNLIKEAKEIIEQESSKIVYLKLQLENWRARFDFMKYLKVSESIFTFEGYTSKKDLNILKESYPEFSISSIVAKKAPTKQKNPAFVKPYQEIVKMFGTPTYGSFDPSLLMSFFFPFFFGFMLSDIGYGSLLLIANFILYFIMKDKYKLAFKIFNISAITSIIFGLLFGSFLGNLIPITPLYKDTLSSSLTILIISLIIGLVHLNLAAFVKVYQNHKQKKMVFDGVLPFFIVELAVILFVLNQLYAGLITIFIAAYFLIKEKGALGVMDITGYFGTWFSYSRLLALSLATAGVALAINFIAQMALNIAYVGSILYVFVLVFGHLFNFGLNILACSVHSTRLHFVEFFSFFYEGEGENYQPFQIIGGIKKW